MKEMKCNRKKERHLSPRRALWPRNISQRLSSLFLSPKLSARFSIGKKKEKKTEGKEGGFSLPPGVSGIYAGYAGYAEFLRGTPSSSPVPPPRVPPEPQPPRTPPNVVGMDEGSKTKDERKKKSVRKARGDRSITNHYGPSGTAKRTSRRRFDACSSFVMPDFTRELSVTALIT